MFGVIDDGKFWRKIIGWGYWSIMGLWGGSLYRVISVGFVTFVS